jgi:hypothetical protein
MRRAFAFGVLAIGATAATAAHWTSLGPPDARGVSAYFDGASLKKNGALRYYSMKYVPPSPVNGASYSVLSEVIDCNQKTITTLGAVGYANDDSIVFKDNTRNEPRAVSPESTGGQIMQALCSR